MINLKSKFAKASLGFVAAATMLLGAATAGAYTFTTQLQTGSTGPDVTALQIALNSNPATALAVAAGSNGSSGHETSYFGPATAAAVSKFQAANGLPQVGRVGPMTLAKLNAMGSTAMVPGCTSTTGFSSTTGASCASGVVTPPGTVLVPGCTSTTGFSTTTGASCATGTVASTGPLSVMLSTDNPATGTILSGQALADLAHFTFTGSGTLTQVTLQRTGLSTSADIANVYLFNGNQRLTDGASVNTNGQIIFSGLNIAVNGSMNLAVKADMSSSTSSVSLGVTLIGYMVSGATTASTANVAGNLMFVSTAPNNTATATLNASSLPTSTTISAGITGYTVFSAPLQISGRSTALKGANFRVVGSAPTDAVQNLKLYVDGTPVGSAVTVGSNGYAFFDFGGIAANGTCGMVSGYCLTTGSHTIDVRGDVQKGSNRTFQFSLQNSADLMLADSQLGINIATANLVSNGAGPTVTISSGSVTVNIDPSFQSMTNVTGGATNATIAKFKLHAYGEDVKVQTLTLTPSISSATYQTSCSTGCTAGSMNNVTLYFNGSQVGSQAQYTGSALPFTLGSSLIIPAGVDSTLEVRADLQTNNNINYTGGTVTVNLALGVNNGQGMTSLDSTIDVPASTITTTGLSVQTGSLAVSKNPAYTNQTVNPNLAGVKIGSFVLQNQSTSEAIRITNLAVNIALTTVGSTNYSNLKVTDSGNMFTTTPINPATAAAAATSSNNFSVNFNLAPGATDTIDVWADVGSTAGNATVIVSLVPTAIGVSSNVTVTPGSVPGQTITVGSGTFGTPAIVTSASTTAQYVAGGTTTGVTDATKATFKFTASSGTATISELGFADTGTGGALTQVKVNGITAPVASNKAFLYGLAIPVPNGGAGVTIDAFASYAPVGSTGVPTSVTGDITSNLTLSYVKFTIGGVTLTRCATGAGPGASNCSATTGMPVDSAQTMHLVGSKPTVTVAQPTGAILTTCTSGVACVEAIDVTITADAAGPITINSFPIATTLSPSSGSAFQTGTTAPFVVKDHNNVSVSVANSSNRTSGTGSETDTVTFSTGYLLNAGQSETFKVFVPISTLGGTGTLPNTFLYTSLAATSGFAWLDTAGGATVTTGNITGLIYNYPSTITSSVHN